MHCPKPTFCANILLQRKIAYDEGGLQGRLLCLDLCGRNSAPIVVGLPHKLALLLSSNQIS